MSVDDLMSLRDRLDKALSSRVKVEQQELESRLAQLRAAVVPVQDFRPAVPTSWRGGKLPPKYRNPENPSETWAGRGKLPRWMKAALKSGRKMSDFRIGDAADIGEPNRRKHTQKAN